MPHVTGLFASVTNGLSAPFFTRVPAQGIHEQKLVIAISARSSPGQFFQLAALVVGYFSTSSK
jgi:hypothetical protein